MFKSFHLLAGLTILLGLFLSAPSLAQYERRGRHSEEPPQWTWDLGAAFGSYGAYSYSELDLGLTDRFASNFNWRNVIWDRFGSSSVVSAGGVDSSVRWEITDRSESGFSGFRFFVGPGVRVASSNFSGDFLEAGIIFRLGGLNLGFGVKDLNYFSPGKDPVTGLTLPNNDLVYFIILSGGGVL